MKIKSIIITFCILLISLMSNSYSEDIPSEIFQKTYGYMPSASDSVVLADLMESDLPFYTAVRIYRNGKKVFSLKDSTIEIDGSNSKFFIEHHISQSSDTYLIFTISGRPSVDYYLVLKKSKTGYENIGFTPSSSADIFGDIDCDGKFEIGGFENFHEGGVTPEETMKIAEREYRVFDVESGFPLDSTVMKALLPIVLKNIRKQILESESNEKETKTRAK